MGLFRKKILKKKHLCCHDKNYYYFWKLNIHVINLIAGSMKVSNVSKNFQKIVFQKFQRIWVCEKLDKQQESFLPNTNIFLAFFIVFEGDRILESEMDK